MDSNIINLFIEIIGLAIATATIIIALMSHIDNKIDKKIDSLRSEIKEDNREIRNYIFAYMSDKSKKETS